MGLHKFHIDKYELAAIAVTIASFLYWSAFSINAYMTFHEYADLAAFVQSFYFNLHYPSIAHGFQFLVYGNHIVPLFIILMPFFAAFQSPITLLLAQVFVISAAGLALFYATRSLTKSPLIGLVFAAAFLLNPGVHGMILFDFHAEAFISLFYILSFYYGMKTYRWRFAISFLLLMCTMEVAPLLGIVLGASIMAFSIRKSAFEPEKAQQRMRIGIFAIAMSLAFLFLYSYISGYLYNAYPSSYGGLPSALYVSVGSQNTIGSASVYAISHIRQTILLDYYSYGDFIRYLIFALLIVFAGFGIYAFSAPEETLISSAPWLFMSFVLINKEFILTWYQYFGFVIAPVATAALLGVIRIKEKEGIAYMLLAKLGGNPFKASYISAIAVSSFLCAISPAFFYSVNINNMVQDMLFMPNSTVKLAEAQLQSIINMVPQNASLYSQPFVSAHAAERVSTGQGTNYTTWPEYVITDFNSSISPNAAIGGQQYDTIEGFLSTHPYKLVARNGTAELYKKI
ncbi:MAG: DUF2079 domain-containing protein [Candidatus Micrarchaeia archaeon]